jgi:hypothetical protein
MAIEPMFIGPRTYVHWPSNLYSFVLEPKAQKISPQAFVRKPQGLTE